MIKVVAVLVVTVLSSGGPHGAKPEVLENATVRVVFVPTCGHLQAGEPCSPPAPKTVASSHTGKLTARLGSVVYRVEALLEPPAANPGRLCESKRVQLRGGHTTHLKLYCSIK